MTKRQTEKLVKQYDCTPRTLRNWRSAGAPLDDPAEMWPWLAGRQRIPAGTAKRLAKMRLSHRQFIAQPAASTPAAVPTEARTDSGASLTRLEKGCAEAWSEYQAIKRSGDPIASKLALEAFIKLEDQRRRADAQTEEAKRDTGEIITRQQCERFNTRLAFAISNAICCVADTVVKLQSDGRLKTLDPHDIVKVLKSTAAAGLAQGLAMDSPPAWVLKSFVGALWLGPKAEEDIGAVASALREMIKLGVEEGLTP